MRGFITLGCLLTFQATFVLSGDDGRVCTKETSSGESDIEFYYITAYKVSSVTAFDIDDMGACVNGETYGINQNKVYVKAGCEASFVVCLDKSKPAIVLPHIAGIHAAMRPMPTSLEGFTSFTELYAYVNGLQAPKLDAPVAPPAVPVETAAEISFEPKGVPVVEIPAEIPVAPPALPVVGAPLEIPELPPSIPIIAAPVAPAELPSVGLIETPVGLPDMPVLGLIETPVAPPAIPALPLAPPLAPPAIPVLGLVAPAMPEAPPAIPVLGLVAPPMPMAPPAIPVLGLVAPPLAPPQIPVQSLLEMPVAPPSLADVASLKRRSLETIDRSRRGLKCISETTSGLARVSFQPPGASAIISVKANKQQRCKLNHDYGIEATSVWVSIGCRGKLEICFQY